MDHKKAGVSISLLGKVDFRKRILPEVKGHLIIIKGSIHQEDKTILYFYAPTSRP